MPAVARNKKSLRAEASTEENFAVTPGVIDCGYEKSFRLDMTPLIIV